MQTDRVAAIPITIAVPQASLVVLIGASGSGKSTFAARHFRSTQVVSSDACRALVADDPHAPAANRDAFAVLHLITGARLARGRLTVVDATNVLAASRRTLIQLGRRHCRPVIAIVLDLPEDLCAQRNAARSDLRVPADVVRDQLRNLHAGLAGLGGEGFDRVVLLSSTADVETLIVDTVAQ